MQVKVTNKSTTEAELHITPSADELSSLKQHVLGHFKNRVKVPGFREGNVPTELVEKHANPQELQTKFLDEAVEHFYRKAVQAKKLRGVGRPQVSIKKFVPFSALEFTVTLSVIGKVTLADYKRVTVTKPEVKVAAKDVNDILKNLQTRMAEKKDVDRAAKKGDQVWIDFKGTDEKGKPVKGADGDNYPLNLGSNTFIPGFEDNLIGQKAGEEKTFKLTFPKDYGVKALQNKKVTFKVTVTKVQEVVPPKLDDEFAKKAGPFKDLKSLKEDIKKQIKNERETQAKRQYESELVKKISDKSSVDVPEVLVDEQVDFMLQQERQNAMYRGATWEEYLKQQDLTEEKLKKQVRPAAADRVKASVILSEIAEKEDIQLTKKELDARIAELRLQYKEPGMLKELEKPEAQNDIASRLMTEKTLEKIKSYNK